MVTLRKSCHRHVSWDLMCNFFESVNYSEVAIFLITIFCHFDLGTERKEKNSKEIFFISNKYCICVMK
jgi:hypothetical protein